MDRDFRTYHRGEIYYANLNPYQGSEQGGTRPVLLLQNNVANHYSPTVIAIPVTSKVNKKPSQPTHVILKKVPGLDGANLFMAEQIRTLDKHRLGRFVGRLSRDQMRRIEKAVCASLELNAPIVDSVPGRDSASLMCLCTTCRNRFYDTGAYRIERADRNQREKEPCTYCQIRMGFDYYVTRKNAARKAWRRA